jgi:L-alanine-DL-glutamate epimerase-like enolase superfamily enzyme
VHDIDTIQELSMPKIARIAAWPLSVPVTLDIGGRKASTSMGICYVEVETEDGLTGHGISAITDVSVAAAAVNSRGAETVVGVNPLDSERIWERLYWELTPRGQSGIGMHAIAAIDVAVWDLKGKLLGQPIWRLLGGARERVPVYATFGFDFFGRDELAEAARQWMVRGFRDLKMTVGHNALAQRGPQRPVGEVIAEDARRVRAVREAVGPEARIYLDANCSLDHFHASRLAREVKDCNIAFFEEPITQNDARQMADLRRQVGIPLACGQNEGTAFRFRELLAAEAVDVLQPNVVITGGFTQCAKIAALAQTHNAPVANGGAWIHYNMHLQAGVANGTLCEYHHLAVVAYSQLAHGLPEPENGWLRLPETPGLGFDIKPEAVAEFLVKA